MSCGCGPKADKAARQRACAVMCHLCWWAQRDPLRPWGVAPGAGAVSCTISGRPVEHHIKGTPCPRGLHPDRAGILTWPSGVLRWIGVPAPHRLVMSGTLTGPLEGCGCILVLKTATLAELTLWDELTRRFVSMTQRTIGWMGALLVVLACLVIYWPAAIAAAGLFLLRAAAVRVADEKRRVAEEKAAKARQEALEAQRNRPPVGVPGARPGATANSPAPQPAARAAAACAVSAAPAAG